MQRGLASAHWSRHLADARERGRKQRPVVAYQFEDCITGGGCAVEDVMSRFHDAGSAPLPPTIFVRLGHLVVLRHELRVDRLPRHAGVIAPQAKVLGDHLVCVAILLQGARPKEDSQCPRRLPHVRVKLVVACDVRVFGGDHPDDVPREVEQLELLVRAPFQVPFQHAARLLGCSAARRLRTSSGAVGATYRTLEKKPAAASYCARLARAPNFLPN